MAARKGTAKAAKKAAIPQVAWSEARPAPVVLVSGKESLLADRAVRSIRARLQESDPALEVTDLTAGEYVPGELLTLASPSLFGESRLIRVAAVERCTDAFLAEALRYLDAPAEGAVLVLRHAGGVRGKRLLDAIRGGGGGGIEVVCSEVTRDSDKHDFAAGEFRRAGRRVSPGALRALVSAFSGDLSELAGACQQLLADSSGDVTESVVDRYYAGRVETSAFTVADAAIAGRTGEALVALRQALATGADPVPMVAAFASKIRAMAKVAGAPRAGAAQLGMAPWQVDRARRDLRGWRDEGLGRCIGMLAETDASVKGASRDPVYALERMVRVVSSRGAR